MTKPETLKLNITLSGKTYVLGILSFNTKKEEFSYHFTYPSNAPINHFNCDTGLYTARFDHITWHQNNAHIKRRDDGKSSKSYGAARQNFLRTYKLRDMRSF